MTVVHADILTFFEKYPAALPLYEAAEAGILSVCPEVAVRVLRTQISFDARRCFAFVWLPPQHALPPRLALGFGLGRPLEGPRIMRCVPISAKRWTIHVLIQSLDDVDTQLLSWLREALDFSNAPHR